METVFGVFTLCSSSSSSGSHSYYFAVVAGNCQMLSRILLIALVFGVTIAAAAMQTARVDAEGVTIAARATHYDWPSGGNSCNKHDKMCISPSDGFDELWSKVLKIKSKCQNKACRGSCDFCCGQPGPSCPYDQLCSANGGHLCVRCTDKTAGACKHHNWVRVSITEACPRNHPCNTCKGNKNPCAQGRRTVDLCDAAFNNIAHKQPSWTGLAIEVSTALSHC